MATDIIKSTPYGRYQSIVLSRKTVYTAKFFQDNGGARRNCVSWYSSSSIEVQYKSFNEGRGTGWRISNGVDAYMRGPAYYAYRFVRKSPMPVYVVFNEDSRPPHCGYLGHTRKLKPISTPIDVFTDWMGMKRIVPSFDTGQRYAVNSKDARLPYEASAPTRTVRKSVKVDGRGNWGATTKQFKANPPKPPKPIEQRANLTALDMRRLSISLRHLGYRSDGPDTGYKDWQRKHGYRAGSPITVKQYRQMKAEIERSLYSRQGKGPIKSTSGRSVTNSKGIRLSRQQWIKVQRALKRSGCNPGTIDGVPGRNTQRAMACWQKRTGYRATGKLTRSQLNRLAR